MAATSGSPQVTTMSYNAAGNETQIKDPAGNTWSYTYDLLGRQTKAVDPDSGTTVVGYDPAGNVAYTTDANGTSNNFTYDGLNRKTAEYTGSTTQGSGTEIATWTWDTLKKGLLSFRTSSVSGAIDDTEILGYDTFGNRTGVWTLVPTGKPLAGTYRTTTTYSSTGLLLDEVPAAGGGLPVDSIALTYDKFGNPITEKGNNTYAWARPGLPTTRSPRSTWAPGLPRRRLPTTTTP
jgi:YD repeat-containing protein